jgi:hypothetical protein
MTQNDQQPDRMGERQRPDRADVDETGQDRVFGGSGGTPGADRLGMRSGSSELGGGANQQATVRGMNAASGTADESGELLTGGDVGDGTGRIDMARRANAGRQSGSLGTRSGVVRSDVPGGGLAAVLQRSCGGLAGGTDTDDVTTTSDQADASQEGANIQL